MSNMPMNMMAKAMKNSQVANEKPEATGYSATALGLSFAWQSVHDQWAGSKQLLHTVLPQSWQTYVAALFPHIWHKGAAI